MSTGGVFKLIVNDGKSDRMILATKLLYQRIQDIMYMRSQQGRDDITPTLIDLERTHIVFVNAHFKPFAAIGYEYNKVKPQSGNAMLGSGVTFSIPQFGDFFHDMVCRTRLDSVYAKTGTTPAQSGAAGISAFPFSTASVTYNLVDVFGNVLVPSGGVAVSYRNFVRYCEFPGNRLFNSVKFDVNGNPLDEYDYYVPTMLEKFTVHPHKRDGYNRLVGQSVELKGVSGVQQCATFDSDTQDTEGQNWASLPLPYQLSTTGAVPPSVTGVPVTVVTSYNTPSGISRFQSNQSNQTVALYQPTVAVNGTALSSINAVNPFQPDTTSIRYSLATAASATVVPTGTQLNSYTAASAGGAASSRQSLYAANTLSDLSQQVKSYTNGPQTPKPVQPPLEIWNKLKFWFNDDVRLSIPSVSIPYGQRFITIELTQLSNLVFEYPSVYCEAIDTFNIVGTTTATRTYSPVVAYNGLVQSSTPVLAIELYINNIFVNPEIHDIFIKRIGFALIRVYRQQKSTINTAGQTELLLSALKWPVEYMFVGVQPSFNIRAPSASSGLTTGGNVNVWRDWHRMTRQLPVNASSPTLAITSGTVGSSISPVVADQYFIPVSTVDSLSLTSHGITIFDNFQDTFFASYAPYHYGTETVVTPSDTGAFFINMTLFPRQYQPSGHLNISRARETYLIFQSSYVSSTTSCLVVIVAVAINFILISDGSAVLRYST
jgi:hypothetical protein